MSDIDTETPREVWEEYERRKARIQNIGLRSWEYEREVQRIAEELGLRDKPREEAA